MQVEALDEFRAAIGSSDQSRLQEIEHRCTSRIAEFDSDEFTLNSKLAILEKDLEPRAKKLTVYFVDVNEDLQVYLADGHTPDDMLNVVQHEVSSVRITEALCLPDDEDAWHSFTSSIFGLPEYTALQFFDDKGVPDDKHVVFFRFERGDFVAVVENPNFSWGACENDWNTCVWSEAQAGADLRDAFGPRLRQAHNVHGEIKADTKEVVYGVYHLPRTRRTLLQEALHAGRMILLLCCAVLYIVPFLDSVLYSFPCSLARVPTLLCVMFSFTHSVPSEIINAPTHPLHVVPSEIINAPTHPLHVCHRREPEHVSRTQCARQILPTARGRSDSPMLSTGVREVCSQSLQIQDDDRGSVPVRESSLRLGYTPTPLSILRCPLFFHAPFSSCPLFSSVK